MKRTIILFALLISCASALYAQNTLSAPSQREQETYTEVALPNPEGTIVKLSSLIGPGKYVLLDFWASWCAPCMGEVPYLKAAYDKYHNKGFEIYGVSLDRSKDPWLKTIKAKQMDWMHVYLDMAKNRKTANDYKVESIPSNFLIGPGGVIVARNLRGEELEKTLSKLF